MKRIFKVGLIAVFHAALCWLVSQWTLQAIPHVSAMPPHGIDVSRWLVYVSKVLYAPLITFGLYPRVAFPGLWIWVPIFANSLIWAGILYGLYRFTNLSDLFKHRSRLWSIAGRPIPNRYAIPNHRWDNLSIDKPHCGFIVSPVWVVQDPVPPFVGMIRYLIIPFL